MLEIGEGAGGLEHVVHGDRGFRGRYFLENRGELLVAGAIRDRLGGRPVDRVDPHERGVALGAARRAHRAAHAIARYELAATHLRGGDVDVLVGGLRWRHAQEARAVAEHLDHPLDDHAGSLLGAGGSRILLAPRLGIIALTRPAPCGGGCAARAGTRGAARPAPGAALAAHGVASASQLVGFGRRWTLLLLLGVA